MPAATGSICDAILTPRPGALTFPVLQRLAGPGLAVTDEEALRGGGAGLPRTCSIVLEPGGAVSLAAALFRGGEIEGDAVICVASGGNVEPALFARAIGASVRSQTPLHHLASDTHLPAVRPGRAAAAMAQGRSGPSRNSALSATPGVAPGKAALKNSAILPEA